MPFAVNWCHEFAVNAAIFKKSAVIFVFLTVIFTWLYISTFVIGSEVDDYDDDVLDNLCTVCSSCCMLYLLSAFIRDGFSPTS